MAGWENPIAKQKRLAIELAQQNVGEDINNSPTILSGEHVKIVFKLDLKRLKDTPNISDKTKIKRELISNYYQYIDNYLKFGLNYNDGIIVRLMIWLFDVEEIPKAIKLALFLINQEKPMPDGFNSSMPTFVCDNTYDWAKRLLESGESASPYLESVVEHIDDWDLNAVVGGKMYAMIAKHKFAEKDYIATVQYCDKANKVNPEAGVKTLRDKALKLVSVK